ncbi:MAG: hypothetical protein ABI573_04125 [Chloroflexota bacterium]
METAQAIALLGFVILAALVALFARRAGRVLYRTRIAENFRGATADLDARVNQSLGEVADVIDVVRRHEVESSSIRASLVAAQDAALRYADEARALTGPPAAKLDQARMVEELERAERALALVEHGCELASEGARSERGPEAETSIKRGYLNLLHARESFSEHARAAIDVAEAASPARSFGRRSG